MTVMSGAEEKNSGEGRVPGLWTICGGWVSVVGKIAVRE